MQFSSEASVWVKSRVATLRATPLGPRRGMVSYFFRDLKHLRRARG